MKIKKKGRKTGNGEAFASPVTKLKKPWILLLEENKVKYKNQMKIKSRKMPCAKKILIKMI